jgi:hypothetical protein
MAPSSRRNVASDICRLLEEDRPHSYCDACLALYFAVSLDDARAITLALAERPGFIRQRRKCDTCTRTLEITAAGGRPRQP